MSIRGNKLIPELTYKAQLLVDEYYTKVRSGAIQGRPLNVKSYATAIAQRAGSAWVLACMVRAAIDGKTDRDAITFADYTEPSDLAKKESKRESRTDAVRGERRASGGHRGH